MRLFTSSLRTEFCFLNKINSGSSFLSFVAQTRCLRFFMLSSYRFPCSVRFFKAAPTGCCIRLTQTNFETANNAIPSATSWQTELTSTSKRFKVSSRFASSKVRFSYSCREDSYVPISSSDRVSYYRRVELFISKFFLSFLEESRIDTFVYLFEIFVVCNILYWDYLYISVLLLMRLV